MSEDLHTHPRTDDIAVFWIPADRTVPMEMKVVKNEWRELNKLVGGYLEQLRTMNFPDLPCGCQLAVFGDEEATLKNSPINARMMGVSLVGVWGDVVIVGEGLVSSKGMALGSNSVLSPAELLDLEGPRSSYPHRATALGVASLTRVRR
jgi:hypothetical protein